MRTGSPLLPTRATTTYLYKNMMKAVLAGEFAEEEIDASLFMAEETERPEASVDRVLVRVEACSLSPGDYRRLNGSCALLGPEGWPYIPGHDVCGVVTDIHPSSEVDYNIGDYVVSTSSEGFMTGGLAQYCSVEVGVAALKPEGVNVVDAACMGSSALRANELAKKTRPGDRILVLRGSGGFGVFLVQLLKYYGAGYVATTSTQRELMIGLGADRVIDYTTEDWWTMELEEQFDVIIDCVGNPSWARVHSGILKSGWNGGRFREVCMDSEDAELEAKRYSDFIYMFLPELGRLLWTRLWWFSPTYNLELFGPTKSSLEEVLQLLHDGHITVPLDCESPHKFEIESVKAAFRKLRAKKGHGKIVCLVE